VTLVLLLVALVVAGVVAAVAVGRVPGGLEEPTTSRPSRALPDGPLAADDLDRVRFSLGLRGYRMDEVDALLDRVRDEVAARDARVAELTARLGAATSPGDAVPAGPAAVDAGPDGGRA
jgi:DivIVA domain-containing protein